MVSRQLSVRQIQLAEKPQSVIMCSAGDHICMSIFAGSHVLDWTLAPAVPDCMLECVGGGSAPVSMVMTLSNGHPGMWTLATGAQQ